MHGNVGFDHTTLHISTWLEGRLHPGKGTCARTQANVNNASLTSNLGSHLSGADANMHISMGGLENRDTPTIDAVIDTH